MSKAPPLEHFEVIEPKEPRRISWLIWLPVGLILAFFIVSRLPRARDKSFPLSMCAGNLRQIGQAMQLYAQSNHGLFPPDLQTLAGTQPIELGAFICPSSPDEKPQTIASIGDPRSCSYIYVGAGLNSTANPNCILALEDPANHGLTGGNVVFADDHAEFLDLPTIQHLLNDLNAGRNPPSTLTPTLSQSAAEKDYQTNWKPRMPQLKSGVWHIPTTH